ncbi:MAG: hypothetical protein AAFR76_08725 [Planctomycetota bacterium]
MLKDKVALINFLQHTRSEQERYHSDKERAALIPAIVFPLAAANAAAAHDLPFFLQDGHPYASVGRMLSSIAISVIAALVIHFSHSQFRNKRHAQVKAEAAENALTVLVVSGFRRSWSRPVSDESLIAQWEPWLPCYKVTPQLYGEKLIERIRNDQISNISSRWIREASILLIYFISWLALYCRIMIG